MARVCRIVGAAIGIPACIGLVYSRATTVASFLDHLPDVPLDLLIPASITAGFIMAALYRCLGIVLAPTTVARENSMPAATESTSQSDPCCDAPDNALLAPGKARVMVRRRVRRVQPEDAPPVD
jgi:hypothetical protein